VRNLLAEGEVFEIITGDGFGHDSLSSDFRFTLRYTLC